MKQENLYILVVRVNREELIASFTIGGKVVPVHYTSLEEAKELFSMAYRILGDGPARNTELFANQFEKMAIFQPAFIKIPRNLESLQELEKARADNEVINFDDISLLPHPLCYFRVKKGLIEKHLALDILRDIESQTTVGPDGKFIINQFRIRDSSKGDQPGEFTKDIDPDEIFRKRGFL